GLVLVAVVGTAAGAVRVLRQLADRQALARADLAAQSAALAIERAGDRVLASARLLADRPAVGRILSVGDRAGLAAWLERFRRTSDLSGCALFAADTGGGAAGGRLLASAGPPLAWAALRQRDGGRSLFADDQGRLVLGGSAPLTGAPGVEAMTARVLDEDYARRLGRQVGLPVTVLDSREAAKASAPAARLREQALAAGQGRGGGTAPAGVAVPAGVSTPAAPPAPATPAADGMGSPPAAARLAAIDRYVADRPLFGPAGEVVGVVEAELPAAAVDGPLGTLVARLMALALVVAALATAASAVAGRWLGRPVRELTAAAARLGRGDLTTPIAKAPGRELGALAATLEDTRRQLLRLTAELRRRQAEGEAVLTGIAEGVFSVDRDRRIRYLNPQAAALLGLRPEEALGRFCGDVLNPRDAAGGRPCEDGCPIVHARFRGTARATEHLQLGGGRRRSVVITSAAPVEERQFLVMRDETDVELARRQRDTVLANISHEFKTPLAAQRASLELLREKLLERGGHDEGDEGDEGDQSDGAQELVLSLERGGLRLTQLIDNLLESVRIESGRDSLRRRPVALDEVVEEAVELTAPLVAQRRQRVEVNLPYPLPPVLGDAPRLVQVFVNLLANAQKFAPAGSPLAVGGEVTQRDVALWVDDRGPGLPPAADSGRALFRRFVRSPEEMAEPEQSGMGLGLWIVQSIVERHGGTVAAEPRDPGTRMRVTLPRSHEAETAAETAAVAGSPAAATARGAGVDSAATTPAAAGRTRPSAAEGGEV
ncbi:MAG TPA: ATP-binding protein, partial [Thermoanaerobaculia bacterium]|nr:ATP-binding protein [Thermoanaerobaculia bacterium]